jgi:hypothetical protein
MYEIIISTDECTKKVAFLKKRQLKVTYYYIPITTGMTAPQSPHVALDAAARLAYHAA